MPSTQFSLRTLRSHGLRPLELHLVARMTSVASLMYASPAWWGFTDAAERTRLNRLLASLRRAGYLPVDFPSFEELARLADDGLFRSISCNPNHVLRHYFKDKNPTGHNLRPVVITLLFLVRTLAILYPGFFMQFYFSAIICLFLFNCLTILVVM